MSTGRAVLALDDILCKLTPEQAAAFRASTPTWLLDQTDAAAGEIRQNLKAINDAGIAETLAERSASEHPAWVRLGVMDTVVRWWLGEHTGCLHDPHPTRPQPVAAAAWKPGLVVCGQCTHLLSIARQTAADRTCDCCGRVVTGQDDDLMHPFVVVAGLLSYAVGACQDCKYSDAP